MASNISPEALYQQLGQVIASTPSFLSAVPFSPSDLDWLGKAFALAYPVLNLTDKAMLTIAIDELIIGSIYSSRETSSQKLAMLLRRALAIAEIAAPAAAQGSFIPAGSAFDAMASIGKILQTAESNVLIVDPYMDEKALTDFVVLAAETIVVRLLADQAYHKPSLKPAVTRWQAQYAMTRALEARLAPSRTLHDRLIAIDGNKAWIMTQSLNGIAARSPATIVRVDPETAALKIAAYEAMWLAATPV